MTSTQFGPERHSQRLRATPSAAEFALTLAAGEGQFVEFKESISNSLAREIVAFANAEGGRIYVGVTDDKMIKGITLTNKLLSEVQDLGRNCDPAVMVHLVLFEYQGQQILVIEVPEGTRKPHGCSGGYFLRTGATSQKMNRDELVAFVRSQRDVPFDELLCKGFRYPQDFDAAAFEAFLQEAKISSQGMAREDLLVSLGVADRAGEALHFNNAGVLFFAAQPRRFHLQSRITCLLFQGTQKLDVLDRKDFDGTMAENVDAAMAFLGRHVPLRYEITGLRRREIPAIPEPAMREAVLNAVIHRDYFERRGIIMVELFRDRLEVTSPGGLPAGLRLEELGRKSLPRNALIADLFLRLGRVERAGTGITRIRQSLAEAGLAPPEFESDLFFTARFPLPLTPGNVPMRLSPDLVPLLGPSEGLSRDQEQVLALCRRPRAFLELVQHFGRTNRTKFRDQVVRPLLNKGLLAPTIPEKPRSRLQAYVTTPVGQALLETRP